MTDTAPLRTTPYCGPAPVPETLMLAWNTDAVLLGALALISGFGLWRLRLLAARRRAFAAASGVAVIAFVSPLCALTVALFTVRGLHHLLLIFALAPALALAFPLRPGRAGAGAGFLGLSAALWAWHVPQVYAAAWDHAAFYWLMQGALILPAWLFFSAVLHRRSSLGAQLGAGLQLAGLAGQMGLIGAILTFAPRLLYAEHLFTTAGFGLDPLQDQQLAGLVMWVPGMVPLALAAGWLLHRAWVEAGMNAPGRGRA